MEFLIIAVLLFGYTVYYYLQMKNIEIKSRNSMVRRILLIVIGLVFFYLAIVMAEDRPTLVVIGILLILIAFQSEGISKDKVVKFGILDGEFVEYKNVLIHRDDKGCSLEFISPSRRVDTTLYFDQNPEVLEEFLKRNARKKIQYLSLIHILSSEVAIYDAFMNANIPHYAGADSFVRSGAFATCGVNYTDAGSKTAKL